MTEKKWTFELEPGESAEPLEFTVTPDFNRQYLEAVEDYHPRYTEETESGPPMVHPALFINYSNITRSPSFSLPTGMSAVHSHEELEYINPGRVGETFRVTWEIIDVYEKRDKRYQVKNVLVAKKDGTPILRRKITDVFTT
ncbi:MAG: MaoC family dehydratase N-terminal domain-containing protein [Dehalococcoidales bacterium]|nr:MaoC family dehydratase N-terminal domain-containing protein [Dehalococcoidales bacterium]